MGASGRTGARGGAGGGCGRDDDPRGARCAVGTAAVSGGGEPGVLACPGPGGGWTRASWTDGSSDSGWPWAARVSRGRGALDLPAESFAAGPVRGQVLVGSDDGVRSTLRLIDVGRGCATAVGTSTDVIRRAIIAPDLALDRGVPRGARHPRRPRRLRAAGCRSRARPADPRRRSRRTRASVRRGPRSSPGAPTDGASPCSRAAPSPAGRGSSTGRTGRCT